MTLLLIYVYNTIAGTKDPGKGKAYRIEKRQLEFSRLRFRLPESEKRKSIPQGAAIPESDPAEEFHQGNTY